jgi:hypothetical protein
MDTEVRDIHLRAGRAYGQVATCGPPEKPKVKYGSEVKADVSAKRMTLKFKRVLEAYPCYWCGDWHIGRAMTPEEWQRFSRRPAWWRVALWELGWHMPGPARIKRKLMRMIASK